MSKSVADQYREDLFVSELRELVLKHKPGGIYQTWLSKDKTRVFILKRKDDNRTDEGRGSGSSL
jgi:hypothetical protein